MTNLDGGDPSLKERSSKHHGPHAADVEGRARDLAQQFNNIFQIMLSAGRYLEETWPTDPAPRELDDIQEAARRGARLARDLREITK